VRRQRSSASWRATRGAYWMPCAPRSSSLPWTTVCRPAPITPPSSLVRQSPVVTLRQGSLKRCTSDGSYVLPAYAVGHARPTLSGRSREADSGRKQRAAAATMCLDHSLLCVRGHPVSGGSGKWLSIAHIRGEREVLTKAAGGWVSRSATNSGSREAQARARCVSRSGRGA
jgi:hypothetical protein